MCKLRSPKLYSIVFQTSRIFHLIFHIRRIYVKTFLKQAPKPRRHSSIPRHRQFIGWYKLPRVSESFQPTLWKHFRVFLVLLVHWSSNIMMKWIWRRSLAKDINPQQGVWQRRWVERLRSLSVNQRTVSKQIQFWKGFIFWHGDHYRSVKVNSSFQTASILKSWRSFTLSLQFQNGKCRFEMISAHLR